MTVLGHASQNVPNCFGKEWDRNAPECKGGLDPTYSDPRTGGHVRERCSFFQECGARTLSTSREVQLLPASSLARPSQVPVTQAAPAGTFSGWLQQIEAQRQTALAQVRPAIPTYQPPVQQMQPYPGGAVYPATHYQINHMVPEFLTAPEERAPGEGLWPVLGREILRAVFKSLGLAIARFFDTRVWKKQ
jgi:hypothetical protein